MDANGDPPRFARGYPEVDPFDPFGKGKVFIRVPSECDDVIRRGARQQKAEGYRGGRRNPSVTSSRFLVAKGGFRPTYGLLESLVTMQKLPLRPWMSPSPQLSQRVWLDL